MLQLIKERNWQPRIITIVTILILFQLAIIFMHGKAQPFYLTLPDLGHQLIPNIRDWFGSASSYIWWAGSMSEEVYGAILLLVIATTGKATRWGIAFALVACCHALFWRATLLPTPPDILWRFPFITGQVPRPDDFWFSGHAGSALLMILYTQGKAGWIRIVSVLYFIFMVWLVLATRSHYTIDVLGSIFVTYSLYTLTNKYWKSV